MASIDTAKISLLTAPSKPIGQLSDLAPACEIWYDGSDISGTKVTAATAQYAINTLGLGVNGAADSRIGPSGLIDCTNAAYDTFGELSDHINSVSGWNCRLLGVLRSDSTNATLEDSGSALNCFKKSIKLKLDTDAIDMHSYCCTAAEGATCSSPDSTFGAKVRSVYNEQGAVNCLFYLKFTSTYAGTSPVQTMTIYSINGATNTENLLGSMILLASTNPNTYDFTHMPVTAKRGERLVVRIKNTAGSGANLASVDESLAVAKSIRT